VFGCDTMEYKVKINEFEGPIDLLLHLIKEANIDIYDIKLEEVTKSYLDYIKAMEKLNLSIASEYLVMAAELIELKSKSLLPRKHDEESDDYEEDPREILIKKLIDYKQYKEITNVFKELEHNRQFIFTKLPTNLSDYSDYKAIKNTGELSVDDLVQAFHNFLKKKELEKPLHTTITKKELSVNERTRDIRNILKKNKKMEFEELFDTFTKEYIVVTFLSILELAKQEEIIITQDNHFDKIYLELKGSA
jgi:segregation and condensation protein A